MGKHRAAPPARRGAVRPRYGRLGALAAALGVTAVALLGGTGVLPSVATGSAEADPHAPVHHRPAAQQAAASAAPDSSAATEPEQIVVDPLAVPADSGSGRRVVFNQSAQRVWLVRDDGSVARTYLVSGSVTDNLEPGSYDVFSRSAHAIGVDDAGTMRYFVRFTRGPEGGAIGFHDIPVDDGAPVQAKAQLGTPQSHGCIRQARKDAQAMWGFAPVGTPVTVVA
jgi:hypothetical protein